MANKNDFKLLRIACLYTADHQNQEQEAAGEALAYYADVGEEVN